MLTVAAERLTAAASAMDSPERLEIYLVQLPASSPGSQPTIKAIVDGYFATGVGDSPPSLSAYQSMEQQYYADLVRFTGVFFTNF